MNRIGSREKIRALFLTPTGLQSADSVYKEEELIYEVTGFSTVYRSNITHTHTVLSTRKPKRVSS